MKCAPCSARALTLAPLHTARPTVPHFNSRLARPALPAPMTRTLHLALALACLLAAAAVPRALAKRDLRQAASASATAVASGSATASALAVAGKRGHGAVFACPVHRSTPQAALLCQAPGAAIRSRPRATAPLLPSLSTNAASPHSCVQSLVAPPLSTPPSPPRRPPPQPPPPPSLWPAPAPMTMCRPPSSSPVPSRRLGANVSGGRGAGVAADRVLRCLWLPVDASTSPATPQRIPQPPLNPVLFPSACYCPQAACAGWCARATAAAHAATAEPTCPLPPARRTPTPPPRPPPMPTLVGAPVAALMAGAWLPMNQQHPAAVCGCCA